MTITVTIPDDPRAVENEEAREVAEMIRHLGYEVEVEEGE